MPSKPQQEDKADSPKQPSEPKKPPGRPKELVVKIEDSPENVAKALFRIKSDKPIAQPQQPTD